MPPHPRARMVLVVDDDPLVLELATAFLGDMDVRTATSGEKACAWLEARTPDLVILDLNMPRMDGLTVLTWIRSQPRLDHVNVLMLTARGDRASVTAAVERGADGYMVKPFTATTLSRRARYLSERIRIAPAA